MTLSAPSFLDRSRCFLALDVAITLASCIFAICIARCPTPPMPKMPTVLPATGSLALTALYAVMPGQKSGAHALNLCCPGLASQTLRAQECTRRNLLAPTRLLFQRFRRGSRGPPHNIHNADKS